MVRVNLAIASALLFTAIVTVAAAAPPECSTWPDCFFPLLPDEDAGESRSVGDTSHGFLVGGQRLRESDALGLLPATAARDQAFGTAGLVALIEHAARELYRQTGTKLWVGNLSRQGGGNIQQSVSHNSGRDADIAFCYLDKHQRPIELRELEPVRANGRSLRGRQFDVARNWLVVKALLSQQGTARVQFLFVASWLKRALLEHARTLREPAELLARAEDALQHPVGSAAHDDHFHVRLYCSVRDIESGCVDGGGFRTSQPGHPRELAKRIEAAREQLGAAGARAREHAVVRLVLLRARSEASAIAKLLDDPVTEVRYAAAAALGWLGHPQDSRMLTLRARAETDPDVKAALSTAAERVGGAVRAKLSSFGSNAAGYLVRTALYGARLADRRLEGDPAGSEASARARLRLLGAIDGAVRTERLDPIEPLLDLLLHASPQVRSSAARALAFITNHETPSPWGADDADRPTLALAAKSWRWWIGRYRHGGREALVSAGFRAARYRYEPHAPQSLYELVRALEGTDHHAHHAERLLVRRTKHYPPAHSSARDACNHWLAWIINHRSSYQVGKPVQPLSCGAGS